MALGKGKSQVNQGGPDKAKQVIPKGKQYEENTQNKTGWKILVSFEHWEQNKLKVIIKQKNNTPKLTNEKTVVQKPLLVLFKQ